MNQWWRTAGQRLKTTSISRKYHTIQAIPREVSGPQISARDRDQGRIPTVVFTQNHNLHLHQPPNKHLLTAERKQIQSIINSVGPDFFCSTSFKLQIRAGSGSSLLLKSGNVVPIKLHRDEESGKVLNMVLAWAEEGSALEVDVPIVFKGHDSCPGLKKGGQLKTIRTSLKYLCPAEQILQKIEVDISNLDIGERIRLTDVKVDSTLKLLPRNGPAPICTIMTSNEETLKPLEV